MFCALTVDSGSDPLYGLPSREPRTQVKPSEDDKRIVKVRRTKDNPVAIEIENKFVSGVRTIKNITSRAFKSDRARKTSCQEKIKKEVKSVQVSAINKIVEVLGLI